MGRAKRAPPVLAAGWATRPLQFLRFEALSFLRFEPTSLGRSPHGRGRRRCNRATPAGPTHDENCPTAWRLTIRSAAGRPVPACFASRPLAHVETAKSVFQLRNRLAVVEAIGDHANAPALSVFATASLRVAPYAKTPGRSGTLPIHRPSSSRSISTFMSISSRGASR